jgi:hypothetical protein
MSCFRLGIIGYPEWTKAATAKDTLFFAEKLNVTHLIKLTSTALEAVVEGAKR